MARLNRRRLPTRRFQRLGRPALPTPPSAPDVKPEPEVPVSSSNSTAALPSVRKADPNAETEVAFAVQAELPPALPKKLEFSCPCGTVLVATPATYDKHSRCAMCQTVMLLNLVYDPEQRTHEIVPFRITPEKNL